MPTDRERFVVHVEALPDSVPAAVRIKGWLKRGLRGFGLKAVDSSPAPQTPANGQDLDRQEDPTP
jgi:hypothetical protein